MLMPLDLQYYFKPDGIHRHIDRLSLMDYMQDIGLQGRYFGGEARERPRLVRYDGRELQYPAFAQQSQPYNFIQGSDIYIAAAQDKYRLLRGLRQLAFDSRRHRHCARAFDDELFSFKKLDYRARDRVLAHIHNPVHELLYDLKGLLSDPLHGYAVGYCRPLHDFGRAACLYRFHARVGRRGLNANDRHIRPLCLHGGSYAGYEPAPADGHYYRIDIMHGIEYLKADRPLPCHYLVIVERVDEGETPFSGKSFRMGVRLEKGPAVEEDFTAVALCGNELYDGSRLGHDDECIYSEQTRCPGNALRVVA